MIAGRERIADIVQQGSDHHFLIRAVAQGAGRGLQPVLLTGDGISLERVLETAKIVEHAIGDPARIRDLQPVEGVDSYSLTIPPGFFVDGTEVKFEVLVREATFNQSAVERCPFEFVAP